MTKCVMSFNPSQMKMKEEEVKKTMMLKAPFESEQVSKTVGRYLRTLRESKGLSQSEVSHQSQLSTRHYQDIEYGARKFRLDTLCRVLAVYGLDFINFFDSFFIHEFQKKGESGLNTLLHECSYFRAQVDAKGLITKMSADDSLSGEISIDEIEGQKYVWDFLNDATEKNFVKNVFPSVLKFKPTTASWSGDILSKSNQRLPVRVYWRYPEASEKDGFALELITICEPMMNLTHQSSAIDN